MRTPAWAATWWQRRLEAAAERRLARAMGVPGWRAKAGPPWPVGPIATVELRGGSRDGQLYRVPASYTGPDGLPDAIAISTDGHVELYSREGESRHYRTEPRSAR